MAFGDHMDPFSVQIVHPKTRWYSLVRDENRQLLYLLGFAAGKKKDHIRGIPPTELTCSQSSCTLPMPYPVVPTQPTLQKSYTQISKAVEWWKKVQYMSGERQQPSKQSPRPSTWSSVLRQTAAASCSLGFSDDAILRQVLFMLPFPLPNKIRRILESYPCWPLCLIWS